jgi:hypothetical protein
MAQEPAEGLGMEQGQRILLDTGTVREQDMVVVQELHI